MRGGHFVREARKRAGMTQSQVATLAGTTQSAVARIENDAQAPTLQQLTKLVRACGFDLSVHLVSFDRELPLHVADALSRPPDERLRDAVSAVGRVRAIRP